MRWITILYLFIVLVTLGSADPRLTTQTNTNHGTINHDSAKIERYLSERTSLNHLEEAKYITDAMRQGYKTNDELYAALNALHDTYPQLTRVISIGKSAGGVDIMAMEISAQAGTDEFHEPYVKLVANMHGNEPSGRELLLRYADMLLTKNGKDPLITALLEHTHIFIVPTLNPDGFAMGSRGNKNRVDLNRNFPDQFSDPKDDLERRQPETRALMEFTYKYPFVMSVNMHEGDLVVNYPFDGNPEARTKYSIAPDDDMFKLIAKEYARHNPAIMHHRFKDGVTNGAAWYPLNGGMQDWNYIWAGCFEVTVEASMAQFPDASELDQLWRDNNRSMLAFTALSPSGVHGQILDKHTAEGVKGTIRILVPNTGLYNIRARSTGHFRRLIMPGDYTVEISAPGYHSLLANITVTAFDATNDFTNERNRHVFILTPLYTDQVTTTSSYVVFFVGFMSMVSLFFVMGLPLKQRLTRTKSYERTPQIV